MKSNLITFFHQFIKLTWTHHMPTRQLDWLFWTPQEIFQIFQLTLLDSLGLIRVKFNSLTLLTPLDLLGGFSNISTNSTQLDSSGGKTQLTSLDSLLLTHFSSTRLTHLDSLGRQTNEINSFDFLINYQSNSPGLIRVKINLYTLLTHMDSAVKNKLICWLTWTHNIFCW